MNIQWQYFFKIEMKIPLKDLINVIVFCCEHLNVTPTNCSLSCCEYVSFFLSAYRLTVVKQTYCATNILRLMISMLMIEQSGFEPWPGYRVLS